MPLFNRMMMLLRVLVLASLCALPVGAQPTELTPEAYAEWSTVATRAEEVLDRGLASTQALEVMRDQLAGWREAFRQGQTAQAARIATLREQIAALGEENAETDPIEITERRSELRTQLAALEAPGRSATEAFERAGGLIGEVDQVIAARQTEALFDVFPAPINPVHWWPALEGLFAYVGRVREEVVSSYSSAAAGATLQDNIVPIGLLLIAALLLALRASGWLTRSITKIAHGTGPGTRTTQLIASLGQIILPTAGIWALAEAGVVSGLVGLRVDTLLELLPWMAFVVVSARWLGWQAFPARDPAFPILTLTPENRGEGRWHATLLGAFFAAWLLIETIKQTGEAVAGYTSVLSFPLFALTGVVLVRLAQLLVAHARTVIEDAETPVFLPQIVRLLGRAVMMVGVVGPVLALFGYTNAAASLVWPTVLTLGVLALISTLQGAIFDIFAIVTRRRENLREALIPTLVGFMVWIGALPVLALIWGVRLATLRELWAAFLAGFDLGGTVISPTNFLTFAVVFAIGYSLTRVVQGVLRNSVLPKTKMDEGGKNAILSGLGYFGFFVAALVAITLAGIDLSGLAIVAGALSVGIGFGLQTIVSNFVSGIILLVERPIKLGDWISVGGISGYVRDISVRSTRIETFDRQDVIVPNADLIAGVVTNYTLTSTAGRVIVPVGVAYGNDTRMVEKILMEIAKAHPMVLLNPAPNVVFQGFGADSLDFEIRAILRDVNWMLTVKSDMNHEISKRFAEEGIEIPFVQRDIWIKNPEALLPGSEDQ